MPFSNTSKSASPSYTNTTKNVASFLDFLRHGKEPTIQDLANYTFQSVVFMDGTVMGDVTFDQLTNITWANVNKS